MNRIKYNKLVLLFIVFVAILIIELVYAGYSFIHKRSEYIYFVGTNALEIDNGNYITVGSNNNNDSHIEKAAISVYNEKKQKTFEKLYNVGYGSSFFGVLNDNDSLVAVGSYEKTIDDHDNSIRRALIVKYDKDGNIIFEKDFSLLDNSKFTSIIKCDNDYIVTGQSVYQNTSIGDDEGGAFVARYSKDGDLLWVKTFGNNKDSIFNDVIILDGYLYVVGSNASVGIIVKYDLNGNYITHNDYKMTDSLGFSDIVSLNGFIYVCGALKTYDVDTDALIVRYDDDCNYISQQSYTGKGKERFNKMSIDSYGNIVVIGTMSYNTKKGINNYDGIIAKYNYRLKNIDSVIYGDYRDDYFTDVKVVNGNYLVVGYSSYEDKNYMSKFINYSSALKVLGVE